MRSISGVGLGLRAIHYPYILAHSPSIPWFEVLTENFFVKGGMVLQRLAQISERYPITFHGVGLSLGSADPLCESYLNKLKQLKNRFAPAYISDHLCWSSLQGRHFHELLPLPYTLATARHVAQRIRQVQDYLGQQILIENVSSYFSYTVSEMEEWEFINAVVEEADCFILLDINNIYVNSYNHKFSANKYLSGINKYRVKQLHLAGHQDCGSHLLDTHGALVSDAVWNLFAQAIDIFGAAPVSIEWDNAIPEFPILLQEAQKAQVIMDGRQSLVNTGVARVDRAIYEEPPSMTSELVATMAEVICRELLLTNSVYEVPEIRHCPPLSAPQRLAIYRDSFTTSLINALADTYEVCRKLVGDEFFKAMAHLYVQQTPSDSPNIMDYGASFADFVAQFLPAQSLVYLADVARLEWAWHGALHGANYRPLDITSLSSIDEAHYAQLIFQLTPDSHLISSDYPIHRIWAMNQENYQGEEEIDLNSGGIKLLIWREVFNTRIDLLNPQEWQLLSYFKAGLSLGELCCDVLAQGAALDLNALLPECFKRGWIASLRSQ